MNQDEQNHLFIKIFNTITEEKDTSSEFYVRDLTVKLYDLFLIELGLTWNKFDESDSKTYPTVYGTYLIKRKDGKVHWETWNGTGWAYNQNSIVEWKIIK